MQPRHTSLALFALVGSATACGIFGGSNSNGDGGESTSDCVDGCGSDDGGMVPSTGCPALDGANGSGTQWSDFLLDGTEVMTAAGSPHRVTTSLWLQSGTLEIEPCAVVLIAGGMAIDATGEGRIVARGTADAPILFDAEDPEAPWANLNTGNQLSVWGGFLDLSHVTLRNGGVDDDFVGTILLRDLDILDAPVERARLQDVVIENSRTVGLRFGAGATLTEDSVNLTIRGSQTYPIHADLWEVPRIPTGSYDGNGIDEILVESIAFAPQPELVLPARGVPYRLGNDEDTGFFSLYIDVTEDGSPFTLRIEPGVELLFGPETGLNVYEGAVLDARGTADAPIVMTSGEASPAAGDWIGVTFAGAPGAGTTIDHAVISYAGEESGYTPTSAHCAATDVDDATEAAAVLLMEAPSSSFITNTIITDSAAHGINRAWQGELVDLATSNTFDAIAGCTQTLPVPTDGECPATVACNE